MKKKCRKIIVFLGIIVLSICSIFITISVLKEYYNKNQISNFVKWKYGKEYKLTGTNIIYPGSLTRYQFQKDKEKFYIYTKKERTLKHLNGGIVATDDFHIETESWYVSDIQKCYRNEIKEIANMHGLKIEESYSDPAISSGDVSKYHKIYGFIFVDTKFEDIDAIAECLVELDKLFDFNINNTLKNETGGYYYFNGHSACVKAAKNKIERNKYDEKYYKKEIIQTMNKYKDKFNN